MLKSIANQLSQGTWIPTITASSGSFTLTSATGTYTKTGNLVTFSIEITITTVGLASGAVLASLPFTPALANCVAMGRERNLTGYSLQGTINNGNQTMSIQKYDNTSIIAAGAILVLTGSYFVN